MTAATSATTSGRTMKLASAASFSARPKKSSSCDWICTLSWAEKTMATTVKSSHVKGENGSRQPFRPRRMPTPIPRKLAISRKLLKKPT